MGLAEILTIVFVIAKLTGFIGWSWWIVFTPMYIAIAIYVIMLSLFGFGVKKLIKS